MSLRIMVETRWIEYKTNETVLGEFNERRTLMNTIIKIKIKIKLI